MLKSSPIQTIQGDIRCPGDKSISHRALILGSLCEGTLKVENFLASEDCLNTLEAMRQLGVNIIQEDTDLIVEGVGRHGLKPSTSPIDCGNSGTAMRLLAGLLSAQSFSSVLVGDASLSKRPMDRVVQPLTQMGAKIHGTEVEDKVYPPLHIEGNPKLKSIDYTLPIASAQVKSCLMLAALYAHGTTQIDEGGASRDHTERMLKLFKHPFEKKGSMIRISPASLQPQDIIVPGDISSAAFFMVAATIVPGSHILLKEVGLNPTRLGVIHILRQMGADITIHEKAGFEPIGDIEVRSAGLHGAVIDPRWVVSAIDEFPIIFIAAAFADGQTELSQAAELRVKEVDRLKVMADNLVACGVQATTTEDGMVIQGGGFKGGVVHSQGDHRVAMAFAIAGACADEPVFIKDYACINTSFPSFIELAKTIGLNLMIEDKV